MKSGIYKILNTINGKFYIGSAVSLNNRFIRHKSNLNTNKHGNRFLQRAYLKYGAEAFEFHILEYCDKEKLLEREQFYIDMSKPQYNLSPTAGNSLGVKHTTETRARMSAAKKLMTDETKKKLAAYHKGRKHTDEHKRKIGESRKGKKHSQATKDKIRDVHLGRKDKPHVIKLKSERQQNKEKWPCPDGIKCKCRGCLDKLNVYNRARAKLIKQGLWT